MSPKQSEGRDVIFEITYIGHIARVAAVDSETGLEVVIQGPKAVGAETLKRNALKKLLFVLEKRKNS